MPTNDDSPWRLMAGAVGFAILTIGAAVLLLGGIIVLPGGPPDTPASLSPSPSTSFPPSITAMIESPQDREGISEQTIEVRGTSTGLTAAPGQEIWVVVSPEIGLFEETGDLYPQSPPAAVIAADGAWTASAALGGPDDKGRTFIIYAVVATETASEAFRAYIAEFPTAEFSTSIPGLSELPDGATVTDTVTVFR